MTALNETTAKLLQALRRQGGVLSSTELQNLLGVGQPTVWLILEDDDWALSPTYDMLPMLYAPVGGELVARDFAARPLQPTTATLPEWAQAKALAADFWQRAAQDPRISAGFRAIAAQNFDLIGR